MTKPARQVAIALASFAVAWLGATILARLLFGSGNILVWLLAAFLGAIVYVAMLWRDRAR
jgi:ABC-type uncharacterized transport system permease subunit